MFCPSCGKEIVEKSHFCMYCGEAVTSNKPKITKPKFSDKLPAYISQLEFVYEGGVKSRLIRRPKRGFSVLFALSDDQKRPTRSDGQAELILSHTGGVYRKHFDFQVKKEDFTKVWVMRQSPPRRKDFLGYHFFHETPILVWSAEPWIGWIPEIHFTIPDGTVLYAKG